MSITFDLTVFLFNFERKMSITNKDTIEYKSIISNVDVWSAETPSLYKLIITLINNKQKVIQSFTQQVGFRKIGKWFDETVEFGPNCLAINKLL